MTGVRWFLRTMSVSVLSFAMTLSSASVVLAASDPETEAVGGQIMESVANASDHIASVLSDKSYEGYLRVEADDALRDFISGQFRAVDDMSWIRNAQVSLKESQDAQGSMNMETTFFFNDTELYHVLASYESDSGNLYGICPELKDQAVVIPLKELTSDPEVRIKKLASVQALGEGIVLSREFKSLTENISMGTLISDLLGYQAFLGEHMTVENGYSSVTAGAITSEVETITFSVSEEEMPEAAGALLERLAEDETAARVMESEFADHVVSLVLKQMKSDLQMNGAAVWQIAKQALLHEASSGRFDGYGLSVTIGKDRSGLPVMLSVSMEQKGIKAELFRIVYAGDGPDHALELRLGAVPAKSLGIKAKQSCGILLQGSVRDDYVNELLSMYVDGVNTPLFRISDLDLLVILQNRFEGDFTVYAGGSEYLCSFSTQEDGVHVMDFLVNGDHWFCMTADMEETEGTDIDEIDREKAFTVSTKKEFFKYMRDASAINMFEMLTKADVPQEYVDMLTDGEAATESSRENKEELEQPG